jgi:hypothetical protein
MNWAFCHLPLAMCHVFAALVDVSSPVHVQQLAEWEPDMERARAAAREILARDEFKQDPAATYLAEFQRRIIEWLIATWERLGGSRLASETTASTIAWVLAGGALLALTWWLVATLRRAADRSGLSLTPPALRRRSARAWAQQAAAVADPREVVRCGYRAALAGLEEEGAWRADEARTPREHLQLLAADHRRRPLFADVARRFEEIWFGARTPTSDDSREMLARLRELGCLRAD